MIRVTVELVPMGVGAPETLGTLLIGNDTSGTRSRGNYRVKLFGKHLHRRAYWDDLPWRIGRVEDYPRQRLSVWHLVKRALEAAL